MLKTLFEYSSALIKQKHRTLTALTNRTQNVEINISKTILFEGSESSEILKAHHFNYRQPHTGSYQTAGTTNSRRYIW